jgi:hypothetical protein
MLRLKRFGPNKPEIRRDHGSLGEDMVGLRHGKDRGPFSQVGSRGTQEPATAKSRLHGEDEILVLTWIGLVGGRLYYGQHPARAGGLG